jgi:hypothetical protein
MLGGMTWAVSLSPDVVTKSDPEGRVKEVFPFKAANRLLFAVKVEPTREPLMVKLLLLVGEEDRIP